MEVPSKDSLQMYNEVHTGNLKNKQQKYFDQNNNEIPSYTHSDVRCE